MITETTAVIAAGMTGLVLLAGGSTLAALPPIDKPIDEAIRALHGRRNRVLTGSLPALGGTGLLLWPVAAVAAASTDAWLSLRIFSIAIATLGSIFLALALLAAVVLVWPNETDLDRGAARLLHQSAHLATWSVSAPLAAIFVAATTGTAWQADIAGPALLLTAGAKIATVIVEIIGTGQRSGWNAGGWARGTSGYATVAWYATLLVALADA